eukprot:CFRG2223T1
MDFTKWSSFKGTGLTLLVCFAWAGASSSLIMLNNYILNIDGFHHPIILCSLGQLFSFIGSATFLHMGWAKQNVHLSAEQYLKIILPIGVMSAGTLATGNAVYLYLSVSFIQMLKAGTPAMTMAILFMFGMEQPRRDLLCSVGLIVIGCATSAYGEIAFSIFGFLLMMTSELFESLKLVLTQKLLSSTFSGPIEGLYHTTPVTFICLIVMAVPLEGASFVEQGGLTNFHDKPHIYVVAGTLGFICNLLVMAVIKRTSSLSFKVLGQCKNVACVIMGVLFVGNIVTPIQFAAYGLSIAGFFLYQRALDYKTKDKPSDAEQNIVFTPIPPDNEQLMGSPKDDEMRSY